MVTARRQIITSALLGMPLTGIFEVTYGKFAALDNSRIDVFPFLHFSYCLCSFQLFQSRAGNSPSNASAVDSPGKSSDALPAASAADGHAEASNIMPAVPGSGSGASENKCAESAPR